MSNIALRTSWVLCIAAFASGCSVNPVVPWTPPARSGQPSTNLDYAETYAQTVQGAYKNEIARQAGMSNDLASGLVVAGALALALAAGKASRGTVAGVALIGGTAYAVGNMNLNKQRLLILHAGHEGIGCARRAVIPLRMTDSERQDIEKALVALDGAAPKLNAPKARVSTALEAYVNAGGERTSENAVRASAALAAATDVSSAAATASGSGRVLVTKARQAGDNLIAAVDKIDAAVIKASLDITPDLTSVPKVIAGLAGYAAQIAPGAGLDKVFSAGLAAGTAGEIPKSDNKMLTGPDGTALQDAALALERATSEVQGSLRIVQSYLLAYQPGAAALESLKDCGVTDVHFPLKASVEKLAFAVRADATKGFVLSGGTKPYVVEQDGTPVPGLTVKGPAPFEARVQVSLSKEVTQPQTTSVLVMDSSNPMQTISVGVTIGEAPVAANVPVAFNAPGNSPQTKTIEDVATALNNDFLVVPETGTTAKRKGKATVKDGIVTVDVTCNPKPTSCFRQVFFRNHMLNTVAPDKSFLPLAEKVKVLPSDCVCKQ